MIFIYEIGFGLDFVFADVDECASVDQGGCEFKCSNYEGGYYCTCDVGYRLRDNDHSCEGKFTRILTNTDRP